MASPTPGLEKKIERLIEALEKDGEFEQAEELKKLLVDCARSRNMPAIKLIQSFLYVFVFPSVRR